MTRRSSRNRLLIGAAIAVVVIGGAATYLRGRGTGSTATAGRDAGASAANSIAILPFVNTGGDPRDEYFGDGMTDELTYALSRLKGLRIAGRSSSFAFKGKTLPAREVGRELNVAAIIEGTVRRSGDRVRITAQLTSTSEGEVLWADSFERASTDVFAAQDAFTAALVSALAPMLGEKGTTNISGAEFRGTTNPRAYDLYFRGRYQWALRGADPIDSAIKLLRESVQLDPKFARGWSGLALAHVMRPNFNARAVAHASFDSAETAARHALTLDSTLADAHSAIAMSRLRQFDLPAAGEEFARARAVEPENATAHHWSALYFGVMQDTVQSDREIDLAIALDPLSPTALNSRAALLADRRRFREATDFYERSAALGPNFAAPSSNSFRALIWSGRPDSAFTWLAGHAKILTFRARLGMLVFAAAASGRMEEARRISAVIARDAAPPTMELDRAYAALVFGDKKSAAELFVHSLETEGTISNVIWTLCDPTLDPIQDEPAFVTFRTSHGLPKCPYSSPWPITSPGSPTK
ncbi:MAG: hypothetical protein ABIY52_05625 [Gemmatimonadaceae bacterium]